MQIKKIAGYIAAHSIPDMYYIMRKTVSALNNNIFLDFEDCLPAQPAKRQRANISAVRLMILYVFTRISVLFLGLLLFQQKIRYMHCPDAFMIAAGKLVGAQNVLWVVVVNAQQSPVFTLFRLCR